MTEDQILKLGCEFEIEYKHDDYVTRRYGLEHIEVEFTYLREGFPPKLDSVSVYIDEVYLDDVPLATLKTLTRLLSSKN